MGCGGSKATATAHETTPTTARQHTSLRTRGAGEDNDFGVGQYYKPVKHLGRGGTGDTYLFKDNQTGEPVAIKFIKRPLPKVLHQNILREFTVRGQGGAQGAAQPPAGLCGPALLAPLPAQWPRVALAGPLGSRAASSLPAGCRTSVSRPCAARRSKRSWALGTST